MRNDHVVVVVKRLRYRAELRESDTAGDGSLSSVKELCAGLRDIAITAGVFLYFVGFVYMYSYFEKFGMSLIATQIPPWYAVTFSYNVISESYFVSALFVAMCGMVTWLYLVFLDREKREKIAVGYRIAAHVSAVVFVIVCFSLGALWSEHVADERAMFKHREIHQLVPNHIQVAMVVQGSEEPTKDFGDMLSKINAAGREGRAVIVGESNDRIYILVGGLLRDGQKLGANLPGDKVFSLDKSRVAVVEGEGE